MAKQITFDVPEFPGYEYIGLQLAKRGDKYLDTTEVISGLATRLLTASVNFDTVKTLVYRKLPKVNTLVWEKLENLKDQDLAEDQTIVLKDPVSNHLHYSTSIYWNNISQRRLIMAEYEVGAIISHQVVFVKENKI